MISGFVIHIIFKIGYLTQNVLSNLKKNNNERSTESYSKTALTHSLFH